MDFFSDVRRSFDVFLHFDAGQHRGDGAMRPRPTQRIEGDLRRAISHRTLLSGHGQRCHLHGGVPATPVRRSSSLPLHVERDERHRRGCDLALLHRTRYHRQQRPQRSVRHAACVSRLPRVQVLAPFSGSEDPCYSNCTCKVFHFQGNGLRSMVKSYKRSCSSCLRNL